MSQKDKLLELSDKPALLAFLTGLAEEAAVIILEVYATAFAVEEKAPRDLVTVADKRANTLLVARLREAFPDVPVVAEESPVADFVDFYRAPACFFVDPLDGTSEFVDRNGEFVVMIGLTEHGRPTAGVVLAPTTGRVVRGAVGVGAEERTAEGIVKSLVLSRREGLTGASFVASHRRRTPALETFLAAVPEGIVKPLGSAGLKGIAVASGEVDGFVHLGVAGKLWDSCATEAIVTAAGGVVTDSRGRALRYDRPELTLADGVVMANPALSQAILEALVTLSA
jgi:3'(2'), 5'-bisphosphate nucleotidase